MYNVTVFRLRILQTVLVRICVYWKSVIDVSCSDLHDHTLVLRASACSWPVEVNERLAPTPTSASGQYKIPTNDQVGSNTQLFAGWASI